MADAPLRPEPEVAIVFTPEPWVGELHRHLADHGGAHVREIVMDQRLAFEDSYEVLVVSHRWPALTRSFVKQLHDAGRVLLGVYDGDEPTSRVFLANLGADAVIAGNAPMAEFLHAIHLVAPTALPTPTPAPTTPDDSEPGPSRGRIVVVGGPAGAGRTEVAVALQGAHPEGTALLVDADDLTPSLAQRLGLPIEPNLRTAIDATAFGLGDLAATAHPTAAGPVLCGLPNVAAWAQIRPGDVVDLIRELARQHPVVIVDIGASLEAIDAAPRGRNELARSLLATADRIVVVAAANPVGVNRALSWTATLRTIAPDTPLHGAVNYSSRDGFRRSECAHELQQTIAFASLHALPHDRKVERAHWDGSRVGRSTFTRALSALAVAAFAPDEPDDTVIDLSPESQADEFEAGVLEATA